MPLIPAVYLLPAATIGVGPVLGKKRAMTLEALNTAFAGGTFLVIAATAAAAVVQLRHLRSSNQLSALVTILEDWQKSEMQGWVQFVRHELPKRFEDPGYLNSLDQLGIDRTAHPWLHVSDYYEQLGSYVKYGLIDRTALMDVGSANIETFYRRKLA